MAEASKLRLRLKAFNLRGIEWKPQEGMISQRRWQRRLSIGHAKAKRDEWTSGGNKRDTLWRLVNYPILKSPMCAIENLMRYGIISRLVPQNILPRFPLLISVSAVLMTSSLVYPRSAHSTPPSLFRHLGCCCFRIQAHTLLGHRVSWVLPLKSLSAGLLAIWRSVQFEAAMWLGKIGVLS